MHTHVPAHMQFDRPTREKEEAPSSGIAVSLGFVAAGAMVASFGAAFASADGHFKDGATIGLAGALAALGAGLWTFRLMQGLRKDCDDCDLYGRHMVGLTFALLVIGLCNAVGITTLAWSGGVGFSAQDLLDASSEKVLEANKHFARAVEAQTAAHRARETAEQSLGAAQSSAQLQCGASTSAPSEGCASARMELAQATRALLDANLKLKFSDEDVTTCQDTCAETSRKRNKAVCFLLAVSTVTSLFGASFYVVNRVRQMRPRKRGGIQYDVDSRSPDDDGPPSSFSAQAGPQAVGTPEAPKSDEGEPFDVHAFWSGACFRVGEGVLFTFAFFWLIWTEGNHEYVIWLPVLGLFVGMFVKTGEAVIFRLGTRTIAAVEALLPPLPPGSNKTSPKETQPAAVPPTTPASPPAASMAAPTLPARTGAMAPPAAPPA